eukprot:TRINITY_DN116028_c0_g1_i1.p1 TRINITY_DN116028_c0_g1~~TRINITY_DN116028_c0_g1_i1.p1  ORF type:complete len:202 (+),score=33.31 TRINITY_DN116028_c0_g1_i1:156-761(+)
MPSCPSSEWPVTNTFLDFDFVNCSPGIVTRSRSSPALLRCPKIDVAQAQSTTTGGSFGTALTEATGSAEVAAAVPNLEEQQENYVEGAPVRSTPGNVNTDIAPSASGIGSMASASSAQSVPAPVVLVLPNVQVQVQQLHNAGICQPCTYFASKKGGCRWGQACVYCHLHTQEEVRDYARRKARELRRAQRAFAASTAKLIQ